MHGGFKGTQKSRPYNLLSEVLKLLSKSHGDQKNGKVDEWQAYLKTNKLQNFIVSFLHHRFNIFFLIGGAYYYHKDSIVDFCPHKIVKISICKASEKILMMLSF